MKKAVKKYWPVLAIFSFAVLLTGLIGLFLGYRKHSNKGVAAKEVRP